MTTKKKTNFIFQAHGQQQSVLEGKLTWLVYMIGAMVGGYSWSDASASDGEETIDASLARRVFQLAQGLDARLSRYVARWTKSGL